MELQVVSGRYCSTREAVLGVDTSRQPRSRLVSWASESACEAPRIPGTQCQAHLRVREGKGEISSLLFHWRRMRMKYIFGVCPLTRVIRSDVVTLHLIQ